MDCHVIKCEKYDNFIDTFYGKLCFGWLNLCATLNQQITDVENTNCVKWNENDNVYLDKETNQAQLTTQFDILSMS